MQTTISISPTAAKGLGYNTRIANASMLDVISRIITATNITRSTSKHGAVWLDSMHRWVLPRATHIPITLNLPDKMYIRLAEVAHALYYRHMDGKPNISAFLETIGLGLYEVS